MNAHRFPPERTVLSGTCGTAERYPHLPLPVRIWELRHNFTAYDAVYTALAEATDSILYTSDAKLCGGHHARVVLFTA